MMLKVHKKPIELRGGIIIPLELIKEMDGFVARNVLVDLGENTKLNTGGSKCRFRCCNRCLKAFALSKAKDMCLSAETTELLDALFDCETGHDGYYLDAGNLSDCRLSLHRDA